MNTPNSNNPKQSLRKNPWFWVAGASGVVNLALLVLIPMSNTAKYRYEPKSGYVTSVIPTPLSLVATNGWIDPDRIQGAVRAALQTFGSIDPTKLEPLTRWEDQTLTGAAYVGWGGEYTTIPNPLPGSALKRIPEAKSRFALDSNSKVSIVARYWTDKYDGESPPGYLHLAVELRNVEEKTKSYRHVTNPEVLAAVSASILEKIITQTTPSIP